MSAPNDFNDIVRADPAGVVITVDHPRGAIDWHLAHPRAEQLIAAIRGRLGGGLVVGRTDLEEHHSAILRVLDLRLQAACAARGIAACDGKDTGPCELSEVGNGMLHTATAGLASALADLLDDPGDRSAGRVMGAIATWIFDVRSALEGKPKVS